MHKLIILLGLLAFASGRPQDVQVNPNYRANEYELQQSKSAKYSFQSAIDDKINDLSNDRTEVRDGLSVKGSYSYSDGFYKNTVEYIADQNGYRVTRMEKVPLNPEGPTIDLTGTASVASQSHGKSIAYRVQSVPIPGPVPKIIN